MCNCLVLLVYVVSVLCLLSDKKRYYSSLGMLKELLALTAQVNAMIDANKVLWGTNSTEKCLNKKKKGAYAPFFNRSLWEVLQIT